MAYKCFSVCTEILDFCAVAVAAATSRDTLELRFLRRLSSEQAIKSSIKIVYKAKL